MWEDDDDSDARADHPQTKRTKKAFTELSAPPPDHVLLVQPVHAAVAMLTVQPQYKAREVVLAHQRVLLAAADEEFQVLHLAALAGSAELMEEELARHKPGPASLRANATVKGSVSALHMVCAFHNSPELVDLLVRFGADATLATAEGRTPLHIASQFGRTAVVSHLTALSRSRPGLRIDLNAAAMADQTPLHLAIHYAQFDAARVLLQCPEVQPNARCSAGMSCLDLAVRGGNLEMVKLVCDVGRADVHEANSVGLTPLHLAAGIGRVDVVQYLVIERHANIEARSLEDLVPLCKTQHADVLHGVLKLLLRLARTMEGGGANRRFTPLHLSSCSGNVDVVRVLLRHGACARAVTSQLHTPLHLGAFSGHSEVVRVLLGAGVDVEATTRALYTPLHMAAQEGQLGVTEQLLAAAANVHARTTKGETPLHLAAEYGHLSTVHLLVAHGARGDATDNLGFTPLHAACMAGHALVARSLATAFPASVEAATCEGETPLHVASANGHAKVVETLALDLQASVEACTLKGLTPLHLAASAGSLDVVAFLTDPAVGADLDAQCNEGNTPLHLACQAGCLDAVALLVSRGASDVPNIQGVTPLMVCALAGHVEPLRCLVQQGGARVDSMSCAGLLPLHAACLGGHLGVARWLIEDGGADREALSLRHMTPLVLAAFSGSASLVRYLVCVARVRVVGAGPELGYGPLHVATEKGAVEVVRFLVAHFRAMQPHWFQRRLRGGGEGEEGDEGPLVDVRSRDGFSALHIAAQRGDTACAKCLVAIGHATVTPEVVDAARSAGHAALADWLDAAASWTPLMLACAVHEEGDVLACLRAGVDPHAVDAHGNTALAIAQQACREAQLSANGGAGPALAVCNRVVRGVWAAQQPWSPTTHALWPDDFRRGVFGVLLLQRASRTRAEARHLQLPHEVWMHVVGVMDRV